jgi:hypothetical protein
MSDLSAGMDDRARAAARLRAAGVPEERLAGLLERAVPLLAELARLAALDPELPEPALIWQPLAEDAHDPR